MIISINRIEVKQINNKFVILTKYIPVLTNDQYGYWVIDKYNDATIERPIQMPFVDYSNTVNNFIKDVYKFHDDNEDMGLADYSMILEKNGIKWDEDSMKNVDVSIIGAQCIMALIMGGCSC